MESCRNNIWLLQQYCILWRRRRNHQRVQIIKSILKKLSSSMGSAGIIAENIHNTRLPVVIPKQRRINKTLPPVAAQPYSSSRVCCRQKPDLHNKALTEPVL